LLFLILPPPAHDHGISARVLLKPNASRTPARLSCKVTSLAAYSK
jgi:hypothetical protein